MKILHSPYKITTLLAAALLLTLNLHAQTSTQNYIRTRAPRKAINTNAHLDTLTTDKDSVMTTIQYVDGLGRPLQTVMQRASPLGNDIIQPFEYDEFGREAKKYLPYVSTSATYGSYLPDALTTGRGVKAFYNPTNAGAEGKQTNGLVRTQYPFAQTGFEASSLNRVVEQGAPGLAWQIPGTPGAGDANSGNNTLRSTFIGNDRTVFDTSNIGNNPGSRIAALYTARINAGASRSLLRTGDTAVYDANQLYVTITKDENWKPVDGCFGTTEEYKDKEGRVVLKRTYNSKGAVAEMLSTYYVYDILGNLAFVLPPGAKPDACAAIGQATIDNLCYQYRYDSRNRLFQKKIPGKGWEFMIYNKLDQVTGSQDSVQRMKAPQEWTVTKYDVIGRPIITGIYRYGGTPGTDNHAAVQAAADSAATLWETRVATGTGYTADAWPASMGTVLSVSYFDDYTIPGLPTPYDLHNLSTYSKQTQGLPTAGKTLVLGTTADYLWTVYYYNAEAEVIKMFAQHYLGGAANYSQWNYDNITNSYNFLRQPMGSTRTHFVANATKTAGVIALTSVDFHTYDHMGRADRLYNTLKNESNTAQAPVLVSKNSYNEIGQLMKKGLHSVNNGTAYLQNVDYRYNARGWLTNINNPALEADSGLTNTDTNDQFGMELKYDNAPAPQYNGNIGNVKTITGALSGTTYPALTYNYRYDKLNRLTNAVSSTSIPNDNFYNENVAYDVMGNITKLNRYDKPGNTRVPIDSLTYSYVSGNKVDRIDDLGTTDAFKDSVSQAGEYTYDGNGNQLVDLNKGLTQAYNMLNLPQTAVKAGVSVAYIYDAAGRKLRKLSTMGTTTTVTEYVNGIQYEYSGSTPVIAFIQTEEGRARKTGSVYKYEYDLKDHLGNTRLTTTWDPSDANQLTPQNSQRNDYYAFGYTIQSLIGSLPSSPNHYLYNHKELQDETGLYDYGARFYDPVIGRWGAVDPLVEAGQESTSPYGYVFDDPIKNTDPDGRAPCCGTPSEGDITGNGKTIIENIYQSTVDAVTSGFATLMSASLSLQYGTPMNEASIKYTGSESKLAWSKPITSAGGKAAATLNGMLGMASGIPVDGPLVGLLTKTPGVTNSAATIVKDAREVLAANKTAGKAGEDFLNKAYGGQAQVSMNTSTGRRVVDNLTATGVSQEAKVGRTSLTKRVKAQIAKDVELIKSTTSRVNSGEWHFFPGATGKGPTYSLSEALKAAGLSAITH
jgi:RHS repeat-associated protein